MAKQNFTPNPHLMAAVEALGRVEPIYYAEQVEAVLRAWFQSVGMNVVALTDVANACAGVEWAQNAEDGDIATRVRGWRDALQAVMPL